jgi:hypothetical protein
MRRKGKRSALVDHHSKNKQHKALVEEMEQAVKKVISMAGVAQRLQHKVAIVTGVCVRVRVRVCVRSSD